MCKYEEKMKALAVLNDAIDKVDAAMEAIDAFAESIMKPEKGKTVELPDLAIAVAEEVKMRPGCVYAVLTTAFDLIKDHGLTVVVEEDEGDDE